MKMPGILEHVKKYLLSLPSGLCSFSRISFLETHTHRSAEHPLNSPKSPGSDYTGGKQMELLHWELPWGRVKIQNNFDNNNNNL